MLHLWVAERFCDIYEIDDEETRKGVIVGAEFPDIRYLTRQPRQLTHPPASSLGEVFQSDTPFEMGMKLHAWLDLVREEFISPATYEAALPHADGHLATLLKFIEEEILADCYDGRRWSPYFDEALPEEYAFAQEKVIFKWHETIQWSMSFRPSWLLWAQSYRGAAFGLSADTLYKWAYLLPELKQEPIFQDHFRELLAYLERELQEYLESC